MSYEWRNMSNAGQHRLKCHYAWKIARIGKQRFPLFQVTADGSVNRCIENIQTFYFALPNVQVHLWCGQYFHHRIQAVAVLLQQLCVLHLYDAVRMLWNRRTCVDLEALVVAKVLVVQLCIAQFD